ncbi:MAG TPA: PilZ domain-containing protein [Candidatus Aminicenantes bacterium]|nr:PilZ domain-containing protein [Candidatus Aminicenantes bacterium]HRY64928.1 PilZ domain-containing protein [Candidatus Aminicenantes bacterium]HRZ71841.1 PilZ domain-containing protein [Candidatus Aminicenantes bacterium]
MAREHMDKSQASVQPVVLVVDDDLAYLDKLQRALRDHYTVHTTTSGVEAIHLIKSLAEVNVLVINEDLPRMKGTELLRFLNEIFKNSDAIIKILMTDGEANGTIIDLTSYGRIDCCLAKPSDPAVIRRKVSFLIAQRSREKRSSMRVTLDDSKDIRIETEALGEATPVNLSENGMFLRTLSPTPEGSAVPLTISLPDGRRYTLDSRIVRQDADQGGVAVEFLSLADADRISLLQFMADYVAIRDLDELKIRYPFLKTDDMVLFTDSLKIESLMREALAREVEVAAVPARAAGSPEILSFAAIDPPATCLLAGEKLDIKFKTSDLLFVSYQIGYATYNFETMIARIAADGRTMVCLYPRVMFYSEKRAERRITPAGDLRVEIPLPPPYDRKVRGRITNISPNGMSFVANGDTPVLLKGTPLESLSILDGEQVLWRETGEVRHVARAGRGEGPGLKYGVQFGISRMSIQSVQAPDADFARRGEDGRDRIAGPGGAAVPADFVRTSLMEPHVIRLESRRGEEIVGLINTALPLDGAPVPVVIVPPAFGKTKETLFGLALTLCENFRLLGRPLAVIRYDGIRKKGESHNDPEAEDPPYEMLNTNFSQGADDIVAVLDWLDGNPKLKASSVILLTFSFSALEARVVLRDEARRRRIDYWLACMGTPEFRDLMVRVNCGLDFLEHYQLGIKLGVMPVLGNLVNVDTYVADGVLNGVATLEQAREDMRHLDLPITWIYGQFDSWVKAEFIRDVMSVQVNAPREVIAVPIGHNARTSKEGLRLFGTITSLIYRFLHKQLLQPVMPGRKDMEMMRRAEKDRLPPRRLKNRINYWQRYLIGDDKLIGFDVMALSDDYQQLMREQHAALELRPGDRLLDLGGGTGNFVEHLMTAGGPLPSQITVADLIPEAMKKAARKLVSRWPVLGEPGRFDFLALDLEMSRYLAVRRFLDGEIGTFEEMADKVENLTLESAIKIQEDYSPRLHRILRGERITPAHDDWLKTRFDLHECRIITDFNRAARYVRGLQPAPPDLRRLIMPGTLEGTFHLPIKPGWYNKVLMSLVLSYIFNPAETLREIRRIVMPGGLLVLSSMRPDTDASGPFTRLLEKIESMPEGDLPADRPKGLLIESLRSFLNDAQELVDLEEAGTFDFFDPEKLEGLLEETGWDILRVIPTYGTPPQGYVVVTRAREANGKH